ncbi:MarR family winged helix-turn-helix transcriptional regulator [Thermithiobacillus plumbiphilus]|uniref:MarR family transcriptional regulator n=1 Tax=Thermithiobacillus plumbiphilus TaxID=1729899 RepID=A0ABU9DCD7_9PROT
MFDRCIYFNINALARAVNRVWEREFGRFGLSAAHAYTLRYVLANPGQTQTKIAEELGLAKSTVSRFVNDLVTKQLLLRSPLPEDRREMGVFPTQRGTELHAELEETGKQLYLQMRDLIRPSNFDELVAGARAARSKIEEVDG